MIYEFWKSEARNVIEELNLTYRRKEASKNHILYGRLTEIGAIFEALGHETSGSIVRAPQQELYRCDEFTIDNASIYGSERKELEVLNINESEPQLR